MGPILQTDIPYDISGHRLPGVAPLDPGDWLLRDDAFSAQMALRDQLIRDRHGEVVGYTDTARAASEELLSAVLHHLGRDRGYRCDGNEVIRPDGIRVALDRADPLTTAGRLVQEDLCLMQKPDGAAEHVLTGAVLCFPAGWRLDQKLGRPLIRIHRPVEPYDDDLAKRVQRLFDGVRAGHPLWRFNALSYVDPTLFQPRSEGVPKYGVPEEQRYIRSERQTILRLPETGAVVFGIHTFVVEMPSQNGR